MSLVDTDVVVWYLRGNPRAARALDALGTVSISAVTYMELVQGCRSQREADQLRDDLTARGMSILPISESISDLAVRLIERYALANGLKVADALIAATAVV